MSRSTLPLTLALVVAVPFGLAAAPERLTERELQAAVESASSGEVTPYDLRSFPNADGRRVSRGRVYTRHVRVALLAAAALKEGRQLTLDRIPREVADPAVWIAWDYIPDMPDLERDRCTPPGPGTTTAIGVRPTGSQSVADETAATAVILDPEAIRNRLGALGDPSPPGAFLAVLPRESLIAGSMLFWRSTLHCEVGRSPRISETAALIAQEDLAAWR